MTSTCYFNNARETYLLVRVNDDTCDYLNMSRGIIEMVTLGKESTEQDSLKPAPKMNQDLVKNATSLKKSVLPKSPLALAILNQILENTERDRLDYVTEAEKIMERQVTTETTKAKRANKAKESKKPSHRNEDGFFSLADLAREMKLDPRDVRAKFRKADLQKPEGGWVFPESKRSEIKAIIEGKKPPEPTPPKKVVKATKADDVPTTKKVAKKAPATKAIVKKVSVNLKKAA